MEVIKKLLKNRQLHAAIIISVIAAAMILRLFNLQIVNGEKYDELASKRYYSQRVISAPRGNIYDRNGKLIAYNRVGYNVQMVRHGDVLGEARDEMYLKLAKVFEKNGDEYERDLFNYLEFPLAYGDKIDGEASSEEANEKELKARDKWLNEMVGVDEKGISSAENEKRKKIKETLDSPDSIFNYFKETKFEINDEYSDEDTYKIMCFRYETLIKGLSVTNPIVIAMDVSEESMSEIENRHAEFLGISTYQVYFREYNNPTLVSHILGYVRAMSEEEYDEYKDKGYALNDFIGKEGIEKSAESYLRGVNGSKTIYADKSGREVSEISYNPPKPGGDVYLTIDLGLQEIARNSLISNIEAIKNAKDDNKNKGDCNAGAVVVSNAKTGEILAMVSYPDFDPNIFLAPSTDQAAQQAIKNLYGDTEKSASLNRATQGLYAIGSTFKPLVGLAGLESGAIDASTRITCNRVSTYDGLQKSCMGRHGSINIVTAIEKSCNIFFYDVGNLSSIKVVDEWAEKFGLGTKTGLEIPEYTGYRSNPDTMKIKEIDLTHIWGKADTAVSCIGQLYTQFTPVQVARYAAALGNGGYLTNFHLVDKVVDYKGDIVAKTETEITQTGAKKQDLGIIRDGMISVVGDTSASAGKIFKDFPISVAGKTGTAETGREDTESSTGIFMCYAPAEDPEIAISIVLEHGVWGSNGAPIARDIMEKYFNLGEHESADYNASNQTPNIIY